ncbi:hypothetical protein CBOM_02406 [Ceraceosorus bombacis]|uniref:Protein-S-isoprenylcysteine O-methyltransferase n=1 Tax=Ceraceosorus bombacis TaxID=401625 RepID=A0A0P1BF09_9BASI|nr:hypothetical protein CBOM_02406 [Ceraceosorus bombacis]
MPSMYLDQSTLFVLLIFFPIEVIGGSAFDQSFKNPSMLLYFAFYLLCISLASRCLLPLDVDASTSTLTLVQAIQDSFSQGRADQPHATLLSISLIGGLAALALYLYALRHMLKAHRLSLIGSNDAPTKLLKSGPWHHIRHPFYTSYMINIICIALASAPTTRNRFIAAASAIGVSVVWAFAAKREEAKFEQSKLKEEYEAYKRQTGMLFPSLTSTTCQSRRLK